MGKIRWLSSWIWRKLTTESAEIVGVPEFLRKVIMSAISSSSMQILWKGMPTHTFKPARGIRQGCPLLPYLFVLCMDWLGHLIRSNIDIGRWEPIKLSRSGPAISHLFFAGDLVIFCKAHIGQAWLLKSILDQFCEVSGHKISTRKSNIYFSKGTDNSDREQEVQNLDFYLGVPLLHNRVTKSTFSFVVDKVRRKFNSWDARKLSIVGRVTLAQFVLLSIPNYFMQSMLIPKGVCAEIERLAR
ncbi:LINE-1 reverse transcriptase isogeny [Gossypium australe]|uniref:LINE-1 reverse transcriptase isogeny n=1 Tax=Gossypium australe TaxID=47621 RepID=A0A5B6V7D4_9ROSI|nr:LINE-1 reverse transcriptase isogeny [Gossypium australe]